MVDSRQETMLAILHLALVQSWVVTLLFGFGLWLGWRVVRSWSSFSKVLLERCSLDISPLLCDSNLSNAQ